jgi:predicted transglutaminase-like cysteine proteinase
MPKRHQVAAVVATVAMAAFILTLPAHASMVDLTNPAFAQEGDATSIPIGHAEFCADRPAECRPNPSPVPVTGLDEARWEALVEVNNAYNSAILPRTDAEFYGVAERWAYPDGIGDCEDYVLAKRRELIDRDWNPSTLLITVVRQPNGEGHAVLMVRTDRGDLILDNQDGRILVWSETPYRFVKRQSQVDAGRWVDLVDERSTLVAARR